MRFSPAVFTIALLMMPAVLGAESAPFDDLLAVEIDQPRVFTRQALDAVAFQIVAESDSLSGSKEGRKGSPRQFWIVAGWLTAATIYDIESTFYFLGKCGPECNEANPIVRPFVERGRFATYAYSAVVNGVVMYIARRMFDRADSWWRVFPVTLTIVHGAAGTLNFHRGRSE